jgi:hypothetical protein
VIVLITGDASHGMELQADRLEAQNMAIASFRELAAAIEEEDPFAWCFAGGIVPVVPPMSPPDTLRRDARGKAALYFFVSVNYSGPICFLRT